MKKLMTIAAVGMLGLAAQAATVDWQYRVTESSVNYNSSGYTLYLVDAAGWDALTSITAETFSDTSVVYGSTTFAAGTGKSATSKTYASLTAGTTTAGMTATALSDSIITDGGTHDFYYVILNGNTDPANYYVSNKATLTGRAANGSEVTANRIDVANSVVSAGWKPVSTGSIPEPTSGILLLLGVAGLALKRKNA